LEKLTAKIILESGLVKATATPNTGWDRIKRFTTAYLEADSSKSHIETYRQELRDAMQMLIVSVNMNEQGCTLLTKLHSNASGFMSL